MPDRLSPGGGIPTIEQGLLSANSGSAGDSLRPPSPNARVPHSAPLPSSTTVPDHNLDQQPVDKAEEYRKWDERGREWLYGYVWFEQRKDRGISRGYMQVSS